MILYLIPNCPRMVKNRINHRCHLVKTLKQLFLATSHSVLLQFEADFYLHHCLRWFPSNKDGSILNLTPMLTYYDTKKNPNPNSDFKEENCRKTRTNRNRGCFLYNAHSFCFSREGGAMWPCSHLITPVGASRSLQQPHSSAVPTWSPSLFCLISCKLTETWDSI